MLKDARAFVRLAFSPGKRRVAVRERDALKREIAAIEDALVVRTPSDQVSS